VHPRTRIIILSRVWLRHNRTCFNWLAACVVQWKFVHERVFERLSVRQQSGHSNLFLVAAVRRNDIVTDILTHGAVQRCGWRYGTYVGRHAVDSLRNNGILSYTWFPLHRRKIETSGEHEWQSTDCNSRRLMLSLLRRFSDGGLPFDVISRGAEQHLFVISGYQEVKILVERHWTSANYLPILFIHWDSQSGLDRLDDSRDLITQNMFIRIRVWVRFRLYARNVFCTQLVQSSSTPSHFRFTYEFQSML